MTIKSMKILCADCPKCNLKVVSEGEKFGVEYVVLESNERYIIKDNPTASWDYIMKQMDNFQFSYVPKFGKYEIEEFISFFLKEALLITKDLTDLFNMEIICEDVPYPTARFSSDDIREKLMDKFSVIGKEGNTTYLMFKWKE